MRPASAPPGSRARPTDCHASGVSVMAPHRSRRSGTCSSPVLGEGERGGVGCAGGRPVPGRARGAARVRWRAALMGRQMAAPGAVSTGLRVLKRLRTGGVRRRPWGHAYLVRTVVRSPARVGSRPLPPAFCLEVRMVRPAVSLRSTATAPGLLPPAAGRSRGGTRARRWAAVAAPAALLTTLGSVPAVAEGPATRRTVRRTRRGQRAPPTPRRARPARRRWPSATAARSPASTRTPPPPASRCCAAAATPVDAAVATAAALGVTEPYSAGVGGGYLVYYDAKRKRVSTIDGRETAPRRQRPVPGERQTDPVRGGGHQRARRRHPRHRGHLGLRARPLGH